MDCANYSTYEEGGLMVYKRPERATFTFQGRTPTGWKQIGTRTSDKKLAARIETMWGTLADSGEDWDLLTRVVSGKLKLSHLYALWVETGGKPQKIRRLLLDADLNPIVDEFLEMYARKVKPDTLAHVRHHIRSVIPEGKVFPASQATPEYLSRSLYRYPGKQNTLRKVHADLSVLFEYSTRVRKLYDRSPMLEVDRPSVEDAGVRFYELDTVERIVGAQPSEARRALFALLYGTAVEVSTALGLTRGDFNLASHEVRAAGTKTLTRDRTCRIADWAWPLIVEYLSDKLPTAPLWPITTRWTVSDWHRQTVKDLKLPKAYPLHCARHHWAVRAVRAGTPIPIVQAQLGHSSPNLTLRVYGRFQPSAEDRGRWEQAATDYEANRRKA